MGFLSRKFLGKDESELEAIARNLRYIVGSRRGSSAFFPDFGLSEPTFRSTEEAVLRIGEEIREAIARYEPRVEVVQIEELYEDERPRLLVSLKTKRDGSELSVRVDPWSRPSGSETPAGGEG